MMKSIKHFKSKNFALNLWVRKGLIILTVALVANHLTDEDNFPLSESYTFPLYAVLSSIVFGTLILLISELNFKHFERKYFTNTVNTRSLVLFLSSTLAIITAAYIPIFYFAAWLLEGDNDIYALTVGLLITLLVSALLIILDNAQKIYNLHKLATLKGKLVVQKDGKKVVVNLDNIAYFYSMNKVLYIVQSDGHVVATDGTLNEMEDKINSQLFMKANRQTLIHFSAVKSATAIENGKLLVTIEPPIFNNKVMELVVSRYKKKAFNAWFNKKQG